MYFSCEDIENPVIASTQEPNARDQALSSQYILPLILRELRDLLILDEMNTEDEDGLDGASDDDSPDKGKEEWKGVFASLMLVNKPFFHAGASLLWKTMDNLAPVLKLLPWFADEFRGVGMFESAFLIHWKRFNLYAGLIQHFNFISAPDLSMPFPWFYQLLTLPGKPDPLFPDLQSVSVFKKAWARLPFLFLLIGPPLRSLLITSLSDFDDFNSPRFQADWRDSDPANQTLNNVLSIMPKLAAAQLKWFEYSGLTNEELFFQISLLPKLTVLHLTITNLQDRRILRRLRELPSLEALSLVARFLVGVPITGKANIQYNTTKLPRLKTLHVRATEYLQYLIWRSIYPPKITNLSLDFLGSTQSMPFHCCIEVYCLNNPHLETLRIQFVTENLEEQAPADPPIPSQWPSDATAERKARLWKKCRALEMLEFQFDEELICNEDLKEILQTAQAESRQFEDVHPLRKLIINTMDSKLDLGFEDLIER
ncbi:hypothetical protein H1R20_g6487, partial [Candolleomyces eurysporus]